LTAAESIYKVKNTIIKTAMDKRKISKLKTVIIFLFCISSSLFAQQAISGEVLDTDTKNPIADATVYINATTIGAATNLQGGFTLTGVTFPCKLIISRVGYDLKTLTINDYSAERNVIQLKQKNIQLSQIEVTGKNTRDKGVEMFRKYFLGSDTWSSKTFLKNDTVLRFRSYTDTVIEKPDTTNYFVLRADNNDLTNTDSIIYEPKIFEIFSVKAQAPLIVDFPSLGYKISIDLVSFHIVKSRTNTICKYMAYYYYQPYEFKSKISDRRYQKNRVEAFNNSREHFCRMLFQNKLQKNGYMVVSDIRSDTATSVRNQFVNLSDYLVYKDNKEAQIVGLKGKTFYIYSFYNYANKPVDMTKEKEYNYKSIDEFWMAHYTYLTNKSTITFASDTCTIKSDGTIFDSKIMFGGKMIKKKIDAMIPDIYLEEKQ
jgi:hypothetical protein